jgi:hypothetical protein
MRPVRRSRGHLECWRLQSFADRNQIADPKFASLTQGVGGGRGISKTLRFQGRRVDTSELLRAGPSVARSFAERASCAFLRFDFARNAA